MILLIISSSYLYGGGEDMDAASGSNIHILKAMVRLLLCIAMVAVTLLAAVDVAVAAAVGISPPEIRLFAADPLVLPDGASAVYTFEVRNATNIQLIEAGEVIKEINNPPSTACSGKAVGRTTHHIRSGGINSFNAVLLAVNSGGSQQRTLALSFASMLQPLSAAHLPLSEKDTSKTKKPDWLEQTSLSSSSGLTGQIVSAYPPPFEKCSKSCDYCLEPGDAAERGFTQQCSQEPCYYSPDKQQYWYCYSKPATVWCCIDGQVIETTKDSCYKKGGTPYPTEELAVKSCQAEGWCCQDGKVYPLDRATCSERGGHWFLTEKEAKDACSTIWCCIDGQVFGTDKETCYAKGGTAYATEAEARKACQAEGWCCVEGKIAPTLQTPCREMGGTWFLTEKEAKDACSTIWCCANGKVMKTSRELCAQMGGSGFASEAEALKSCQAATTCWCCAGGKVFQSTLAQCSQSAGNCYSTQAEALRYCQQMTTCWCCAGGKVFQSTLAQCSQSAGNCYSTQAEAVRYCQQTTTCWCCAGGKVFQSTPAQCKQSGGSCYSSQLEATKACQQYIKPPILK
jgi:hypothetical protein